MTSGLGNHINRELAQQVTRDIAATAAVLHAAQQADDERKKRLGAKGASK